MDVFRALAEAMRRRDFISLVGDAPSPCPLKTAKALGLDVPPTHQS
jgi:hypothetical protein